MDMVPTDHTTQYLNLVPLACLTDQLANPESNISDQHLVTVFGDPNEMVFDLVLCVAALAVFHDREYKSAASRMLPA